MKKENENQKKDSTPIKHWILIFVAIGLIFGFIAAVGHIILGN